MDETEKKVEEKGNGHQEPEDVTEIVENTKQQNGNAKEKNEVEEEEEEETETNGGKRERELVCSGGENVRVHCT